MAGIARFAWPWTMAVLMAAAGFAPEPTVAKVEVERVISPGGIEAWLVEDHLVPVIAVAFVFRGGSAVDPEGKEGLAEMASALQDEGAGELDSQAFQQRLTDLAISLSFSAGRDTYGGDLKTLTENQAEAFELLRLALTAPRFDAEPVERIRSQILAVLAREAEDPDAIAGRNFRRMVFPGHPYGREPKGTPETIRAITADDLDGFVARHLARDNLVVGVTGDITARALAPLLDQTFGALPETAHIPPVAETTPVASGRVQVEEKDIPQSVVVFGHEGLKRDHPDFIPAYVLNYILGGGGFTSRLVQEVREKRGLAYSVYSYLQPMDHAALVVGGVATENARAGRSIELIRGEWRRMRESGPTVEELGRAKTYLTGSYALRFTRTDRIARILVGVQLDRLGIDYIDRRNGLIEAVTLADVRRVANRLLDPEALSFTVVGRPDGLPAGH
ncbi:MAG: M16 family metallopeptidase, partial [Kiloniellales bacterium]